jgi:hypothetical protein
MLMLTTNQGDSAMNRYHELTDTQQAHVDAYINAIASEGQTEITERVSAWVDDARAALTDLEKQSETTARHANHRLISQRVAPAMLKNCGTVRHALAMIVDATVRPTL